MSCHGTHPLPFARYLSAVLAISCLLLPAAAAAAEPVGRALVVAGGVTAERGDASSRGLGRGDPVHAGDTIRTGPRGRVQIRFNDGGMVDLEPSSRLEVAEYVGGDGDGNVVMDFLRGAMRTITGAIGADSGETYQMNTTVATIGVRGTAYALEYCTGDCVSRGGEEGLYGRVDAGTVTVDGPGGTGRFDQEQYFVIPEDGAPERIVAPPDGILEGGDADSSSGDDEELADATVRPSDAGTEEGGRLSRGGGSELLDPGYESADDPDNRPDPETRPGTTAEGGFGGAFIGSSGFAAYRSPTEGDVRVDDQGRVVGAEFGDAGFVDASELEHTGGSVEVFDFSNETTFDVAWGSWADDSGTVDGGDIAGFVYTLADPADLTTADEIEDLGASGRLGFYGDAGGPPAIASGGEAWEINTLTLDVDFGASTVEAADIVLNPPGELGETVFVGATDAATIDADGSFAVADMTGSDLTETVQYEGDLEGGFLGSGADGALVAFEVREVDGERRIVGSRVLTPQE